MDQEVELKKIINAQEQLKLDVLYKLSHKKIEIYEAAKILNVSERTVKRYLKKYQDIGFLCVWHGNKGKIPKNRISKDLKTKVQSLVKDKYYDLNMLHCLEKLKSDLAPLVWKFLFLSYRDH